MLKAKINSKSPFNLQKDIFSHTIYPIWIEMPYDVFNLQLFSKRLGQNSIFFATGFLWLESSYEIQFFRHMCSLPRSNSPARKRSVRGNSGNFVKAVFRPEIFRIFSNAFRTVPAGRHRKLTGIHRKISGRDTASMKSLEPTVSLSYCPTWVEHRF